MPILSFRRPEEALDYYNSVLSFIDTMQELIKNPSITKNLSKQLSDAYELSELKKKEQQEAEETISQSSEFLEELENMKKLHAKKVSEELSDISNKRSQLQSGFESLEIEKKTFKEKSEKTKAEFEDKFSIAKQLSEATSTRISQADKLEKDLAVREADHVKNISSFKQSREASEANLLSRKEQFEKDLAKLDEDRKTFEAHKNKIDALLKASL